ncbi:MAG: 1,4-alpha-glucan branching protein domain-containing protein [Promethearchaeota archaeon]
MNGVFALMLHGHIPYCKKSGVWPAGEEWLFEAMNETYLPLLMVLRRFQRENIRPRLMVGVVPILAEHLADDYMNQRFCEYMETKIRAAESDVERFSSNPQKQRVALYWEERFKEIYDAYLNHFFRDILGSLKWLQEEGVVEVLTSAATHGFLPLLERDSAVYSQVHLGVETYKKHFGRAPSGFWLPECAYRPAEWSRALGRMRRPLDEWLADEGIRYFFVEGIGITGASLLSEVHPGEGLTTLRGYKLESGVCVFGRNSETGKQVWSPDFGYPGDPWYLEFHKKDGQSGLHYWRVTGPGEKQLYDPAAAAERVESHATHFVGLLKETLASSGLQGGEVPPVVVSPYDWELFGHWWHEGVDWIDRVFRELANDEEVEGQSLGSFVRDYGNHFSTIDMRPSTWGLNSDFTVWQNPEHGWIWPIINPCCLDFERVLAGLGDGRDLGDREVRILKQAGRELLLMEGSDWPFLLFTEQAKQYANDRFHHHHQRFLKLLWAAKDFSEPGRINEYELRQMEDIDTPWPELDCDLFRERS